MISSELENTYERLMVLLNRLRKGGNCDSSEFSELLFHYLKQLHFEFKSRFEEEKVA